ncbi:hypothetical protein SO802_010222 [Lithocarpus litseifolius]|uniref:Uncharacterized protein n=1 Tax=Lithocarpus litseifolius TaxID=425828 RepID=A0AAW2DHH8_9ROSI
MREGGKGPFLKDAEPQKGAKQAKVTQNLANKRGGSQVSAPAWMPALAQDGAPLPANASIRHFQVGKAGYVVDAVEQALQLLEDMSNWRSMRKYEVFLSLKSDLALAVQAAHRAEEIVISSHRLAKDEEGRAGSAMKAFEVAKRKSQDLAAKLAKVDRDKKSAEAALDVVDRQTEALRKQLCQAKDELAVARGVVETKEALRAEVSEVCRIYYLQVWNEAHDQVGVKASSALRRVENVYYPSVIRASSFSSSKADSVSKEVDEGKESPSKALPTANIPSEVVEQSEDAEKAADASKEVAQDAFKEPPKENEASQHMEIMLATLPLPSKEDLKGKGPASTTAVSIQPLKTQKDKLVIRIKP